MNKAVITPEVQTFLREHLTDNPAKIALAKSPFPEVTAAELAQQLDGLKRSQKKLPLWFHTHGIYFPVGLSLEQSSSQLTAAYKGDLLDPESRLIDLTGGFGVDSHYFSKAAKQVIYCERQGELTDIVAHNASLLSSGPTIFHHGDGIAYLETHPDLQLDYIYLDPSRRVKQQRVFLLSDCEPNVAEHLSLFFRQSRQILVKTSPLLDISAALQELKQVKAIHILSVQNECKELLFLMDRNFNGNPEYCCALLSTTTGGLIQLFRFTLEQEQNSQVTYAYPERFLYEPDASLLKAGCFRLTGSAFHLAKLHQHTHLYTSKAWKEDFPGRGFEIVDVQAYGAFKKRKALIQANVSTRNFPLKPEELKKRHKIKDGGEDYLFFCTLENNELAVIRCRKPSSSY